MTTTTKPLNDHNVAYFTLSRGEALALIRDLAWALADSDSIDMEFRTDRTTDYERMGDFEAFHEIRLGLRSSIGHAVGVITDSATWEDCPDTTLMRRSTDMALPDGVTRDAEHIFRYTLPEPIVGCDSDGVPEVEVTSIVVTVYDDDVYTEHRGYNLLMSGKRRKNASEGLVSADGLEELEAILVADAKSFCILTN